MPTEDRNQTVRSESQEIKLADVLCAQIVDLLGKEEFPERSRLPTETELARRFGVSRPTVREALSRLRSEGIIESRRGSGSYVLRKPGTSQKRFGPLQSVADIEHFYLFRACIETGAAELAAVNRDEDDVAALNLACAALDKVLDAGASSVEEDRRFHQAVARASHNSFFISALEMIAEQMHFSMQLFRTLSKAQDRARTNQVRKEHQAILRAIVKQAPADAFRAMRAHVDSARRRIFEGTLK